MSLADHIVVMCEGALSSPQRVQDVTRDQIGLLMTHRSPAATEGAH